MSSSGRKLISLVGASMAGAVVLGLAGVFPTNRLAGSEGLAAMAVGIGISLVGSVIAALPIALSKQSSPAGRQTALLGAMAARMFATLILFVVAALCRVVPNAPMAVWTGLSYLVLLGIETFVAIQLIRRREQASR